MPRNEFCGNSAALLLVIVSISSTSLKSVNKSTVKMVLPQIVGGGGGVGWGAAAMESTMQATPTRRLSDAAPPRKVTGQEVTCSEVHKHERPQISCGYTQI